MAGGGIQCGSKIYGHILTKDDWDTRGSLLALEKIFNKLDRQRAGHINVEEYCAYLAARGVHVDAGEVHQLASLAGDRGIRMVDIQQHLKHSKYLEQLKKSCWDLIREIDSVNNIFKVLDVNGDGTVSKEEFHEIVKSINDDQLEIIFRKYDQDKDNILSFEEFKLFLDAKKTREIKQETKSSQDQNYKGDTPKIIKVESSSSSFCCIL